jgi:transcriptional regulator of acetoin/glycerol metabolism
MVWLMVWGLKIDYGGNRAAASRALGIGRTTPWRLMKT